MFFKKKLTKKVKIVAEILAFSWVEMPIWGLTAGVRPPSLRTPLQPPSYPPLTALECVFLKKFLAGGFLKTSIGSEHTFLKKFLAGGFQIYFQNMVKKKIQFKRTRWIIFWLLSIGSILILLPKNQFVLHFTILPND